MPLVQRPAHVASTDRKRSLELDIDALTAQLADPSAPVRRWAARDLAQFPEAAAALVARLRVEADLAVREVILTTLTRLGNGIAVEALVDCLRCQDAQLRNDAIEAMKALPDAVAPIMDDLLLNDDPDVRIFAVNILESLRHPHVERWLIEVIETDPEVNVCGAAVDLLSEVGTPAAHAALLRLQRRFPEEPYIQFAAELALKRTAGAQAERHG
jgi:HEAT repeat protein